MKRLIFLTVAVLFCCLTWTSGAWAADKAAAKTDHAAAAEQLLTQKQVEERLQTPDSPVAYVKIDEDAYKVFPDLKDKKTVRKELLKNLPTNKVLYLLTTSEQSFTTAFNVIKELEKSGRLYDNSRYMGGRDDSDAGDGKTADAKILKFWFMKIPRGSAVYDDDVNIGIGIGIGRHHHGGGIGIGW